MHTSRVLRLSLLINSPDMEATAGGYLPITVPLLMVGDTKLFSVVVIKPPCCLFHLLLPLTSRLPTVSALVLSIRFKTRFP
jgi:hypothetical protein